MKYSVLSLFLVTSFAPISLPAMEHQSCPRLVDWNEKTDLQKNIRTITCAVNNASYSGVKGHIEIERQHCIITGKLVRILGTITQNTGVAFPIAPTDISTCFDQISALRLTDLRNEQKQRAEKEVMEAKKLALAGGYYRKQAGWHTAYAQPSSLDN